MLSPAQAYAIASQWGSYIRAGDPGAVFYTFHCNDARPEDENHRRQCLAGVDNRLARVRATAPADARQLRRLRAFFVATPTRVGA